MKHGQPRHPQTKGRGHVSQLRQSRISQNFFDVSLDQGAESRVQTHSRPKESKKGKSFLGEKKLNADKKEDSRRNHGRGMDQGGDGGGTGHRIGQPDVQGKLGGFADETAGQGQA